jgi:hypothetical protein
VKAALDEALRGARRRGSAETILFNLCGHGHFDMQAYIDYFVRARARGIATIRRGRAGDLAARGALRTVAV